MAPGEHGAPVRRHVRQRARGEHAVFAHHETAHHVEGQEHQHGRQRPRRRQGDERQGEARVEARRDTHLERHLAEICAGGEGHERAQQQRTAERVGIAEQDESDRQCQGDHPEDRQHWRAAASVWWPAGSRRGSAQCPHVWKNRPEPAQAAPVGPNPNAIGRPAQRFCCDFFSPLRPARPRRRAPAERKPGWAQPLPQPMLPSSLRSVMDRATPPHSVREPVPA